MAPSVINDKLKNCTWGVVQFVEQATIDRKFKGLNPANAKYGLQSKHLNGSGTSFFEGSYKIECINEKVWKFHNIK